MAEENEAITVHGVTVTAEQLTFRERREVRRIAEEVAISDEADEDDMLVAIVTVVARRSVPDFTVEQAMDMTPDDLVPAPAPPTKRAAKSKATP